MNELNTEGIEVPGNRIRAEVVLKNRDLWNELFKAGGIGAFCAKHRLPLDEVNALVEMRMSPFENESRREGYTAVCKYIAKEFKMETRRLFPAEMYRDELLNREAGPTVVELAANLRFLSPSGGLGDYWHDMAADPAVLHEQNEERAEALLLAMEALKRLPLLEQGIIHQALRRAGTAIYDQDSYVPLEFVEHKRTQEWVINCFLDELRDVKHQHHRRKPLLLRQLISA